MVEEAALIIGATPQTIRKWGNGELPLLTSRRPHLVNGSDLIAYIKARADRTQRPKYDFKPLILKKSNIEFYNPREITDLDEENRTYKGSLGLTITMEP